MQRDICAETDTSFLIPISSTGNRSVCQLIGLNSRTKQKLDAFKRYINVKLILIIRVTSIGLPDEDNIIREINMSISVTVPHYKSLDITCYLAASPHAVYMMRPIATDAACSVVCVLCVCVCVLGTQMSCTKTAEPINIPFGGLTRVGPRNHVLGGSRSGE